MSGRDIRLGDAAAASAGIHDFEGQLADLASQAETRPHALQIEIVIRDGDQVRWTGETAATSAVILAVAEVFDPAKRVRRI